LSISQEWDGNVKIFKGRTIMGLKITCPKNSKHDRFITTAHVMQEWKVDNNGELVTVTDNSLQVTHFPEEGNLFTCKCGAEAIVEEV
jgi:hypothetical protein